MLTERLAAPADELAARTGWVAKPEGLCKGELCVPLPAGARLESDLLDLDVVAERLGMPVVHDDQHGLWALGPATASGRALDTAVAPAVELPDVDGNPFKLSSLLGQKALLVAWASW